MHCRALLLAVAAGLVAGQASAVIIYQQDFESFTAGVDDSTDVSGLVATDVVNDAPIHTEATLGKTFPGGASGNFLFADQLGGATAVITIADLDISGLSGIVISFQAASLAGMDQPAEGIEVSIKLDDDTPLTILADRGGDGLGGFVGTFSGTTLLEPSDGSDNAATPSAFQTYTLTLDNSVTAGKSTLDLIITEFANANLEDIAYDNFLVTLVPEPTSLALLGLGGLCLLGRSSSKRSD